MSAAIFALVLIGVALLWLLGVRGGDIVTTAGYITLIIMLGGFCVLSVLAIAYVPWRAVVAAIERIHARRARRRGGTYSASERRYLHRR